MYKVFILFCLKNKNNSDNQHYVIISNCKNLSSEENFTHKKKPLNNLLKLGLIGNDKSNDFSLPLTHRLEVQK